MQRPLGIAFEECVAGSPNGVVVASLVRGGNAEADGRIWKGDILIRCSAVILGGDSALLTVGGGQQYTNWKRELIPTTALDFETIMSAMESNSGRFGYTDILLEFRHTDDSVPSQLPVGERRRLDGQQAEEWDAAYGTTVNGISTPLRAPKDDFDF